MLPEYVPAGVLGAVGLTAPEAQLLTAPNLVNFLNGMVNLIRDGLSSCNGGFGYNRGYNPSSAATRRDCAGGLSPNQRQRAIRRDGADGNLTFAPSSAEPSALIDELDLLLTGGRASEHTKRFIESAYAAELQQPAVSIGGRSVEEEALWRAQELFVASAEFHATNSPATLAGSTRPAPSGVGASGRPYKAVVVLFLNGGIDSYNVIVPHSQCSGPTDLHEEYRTVRGNLKLERSELLNVSVPSGTQPCDVFGIHPKLPFVRDLYVQGDAAFVANIGPLAEPITRDEWKAGTKRVPVSLFAHNWQQLAAQNVHADALAAQGVFGRLASELMYRTVPAASTGVYSINGGPSNTTPREPLPSPSPGPSPGPSPSPNPRALL